VIFIIGYGNPLRGDDVIGQRIAQLMKYRFAGKGVQVKTSYQLTPELVEPISHAQQVFFIDARLGETPGLVMQESVKPETDAGAFTHNVSPATLLDAASELYGATPLGILISIVGASFDYGSELSPQIEHMLPVLTDQVEEIIRTHSGIAI
jgi:hydrogenase maturation protease